MNLFRTISLNWRNQAIALKTPVALLHPPARICAPFLSHLFLNTLV
jgi:hypothetical protein